MKQEPKKLSVGFLFDDTLDSSDGIAQYVKTVGSWLSDQGHTVSYLVGETNLKNWHGGQIYSLATNLPVAFNGNNLSVPLPASSKKIKDLLNHVEFDVLHVQMPHSPFMSQKVINRASKNTGVVGTFHVFPANFLARWGSKLLRIMYLRGLDRVDKVLAVSTVAQDFAKNYYGLNSHILPNTIDTAKFKTDVVSKNQYPRIVFLGRLVKRKGCMELIKAFKIIQNTRPNIELVIAGNGPQLKKLQEYASKHGLDRKVKFLGKISEQQKPILLKTADVACFPSLYGESFGIVLIEAMAAGSKTILAGNNPGYHSVLKDKPELLVDPNNSEVFAARLLKLLSDQALARQINQWLETQAMVYDINTVGKKLLDTYAEAIALKAARRHN